MKESCWEESLPGYVREERVMLGREPPWVCEERGKHAGKRTSLGMVGERSMLGREPP